MSRLFAVVGVAGLLASCSAPDKSQCVPTSDKYSRLLRLGLDAPDVSPVDIFVAPSAVPGTWYVVASIDDASPVWVTDRDPSGVVVGQVLAANHAAQRLSKKPFNMPLSFSELAQAAGSPDAIRDAENCVTRG